MKKTQRTASNAKRRHFFDQRLAGYAAATSGVGAVMASSADGAIVGNATVQPFGINEFVNIDFNADGQVDYQLDHDRVDLGGGNVVDYLQVDKNDFNGASLGENPLPISGTATFPLNSTTANVTGDAKYVTPTGGLGHYPAALPAGTLIGPASTFDFQEGTNFDNTGKTIRANRLIDEDATQVDQVLGGLTPAQVQVPTNGPNFLGLAGEVRYLGMQMNLAETGVRYGWIGIRIDNEADATGAVVGYAYETTPGVPIRAGVVPEPGSLAMAAMGSFALLGAMVRRRRRGRRLN